MLTVYGTFSRPGEARVPERGKEGQGGSPWCRVTAAGSSRVAASQISVFKNCVLVPTSRLMTLFFFFPQGSSDSYASSRHSQLWLPGAQQTFAD